MANYWEYMIINPPFNEPGRLVSWLNDQGKEGWELFRVEPPQYWFKRQVTVAGASQSNFGR
jgi:hypothetical protein